MTEEERELLLTLAKTVSEELQNDLAVRGMLPGTGVGGRRLIRIAELARKIADASKVEP